MVKSDWLDPDRRYPERELGYAHFHPFFSGENIH